MAAITIQIGALSASVSASDSKATEIVGNFADAIEAEGTNQQRLEAVVRALARHMVERGTNHAELVAVSEARATVRASGKTWD